MIRARRGFVLVAVLTLVAALLAVLLAAGAQARLGSATLGVEAADSQARRHALVALHTALGELQRVAGGDEVLTAMAGVGGVAAGSGHPTRHWCGAWSGGEWRGWLVTGCPRGAPLLADQSAGVELLGSGSLGADGTDKEHVRVPLQPVVLAGGTPAVRLGDLAWWVGDEGAKLSARIPAADAAQPGGVHALDELIPTLPPTASSLGRVEAYGQVALAATPVLTPGQLQANLCALTVTHVAVDATGRPRAGALNVNTSVARYWRGVAATYNRLRPAEAPLLATATFATAMRDAVPLADDAIGKVAGEPFGSVDQFLASSALRKAVETAGGAVDDFAGVMHDWLVVRSDTFRIRAYGNCRNRADAAQIEAEAWCEAIVQRTPTPLPGFGRRFVVSYFRWLGPDDI